MTDAEAYQRSTRLILGQREGDRVEVETRSDGTRMERRFRAGSTTPYFEMVSLPAGDNWLPKFSDEELAALKRDLDEYRRLGHVIDL